MKYVGSKARILKYILPTIQSYADTKDAYIEPFVGGANVICKVKHEKKFGYDACPYLISLLAVIQEGWTPPTTVTEEDYKSAKEKYNNRMFDSFLGDDSHEIAFIAYCCSYGGKWWGGYARGDGRNYADEASRHLVKQSSLLKNVTFRQGSYLGLKPGTDYWGIPENSLVYCDPPYQGTTSYNGVGKFDHDEFWDWCRETGYAGNTVLVSEYSAPDDFECLIEVKGLCSSLTQETGSKKATEKLFLWKG